MILDSIENAYKKIIDNKRIRLILSGIVFALGILTAFIYIYFFERNEINSDYTDTLLWAVESLKARRVYNPGFYYAYMLPFGGSIIMGIPAFLFGFTYKAHIIGMMLFTIILGMTLFFFYKVVFNDLSIGLYLAGLTIIIFTCSKSMRLIFYGHIIQYSLGTVMVCIAMILLNSIFEKNVEFKMKDVLKNKYCLLIFIFSVLCMTNGVNIAPFYFAPVFVGVVFEAFLDRGCAYGDDKFSQTFNIAVILVVASIIGFAINGFLQRNIDSTYVDTLMCFRSVDQWFFSTRELLATWCGLGVGSVASGSEIASVSGITAGIMYIMSLAILIAPVIGLCLYSKIESRIIRVQLIAHFVILLVTWLTVSVIQTENIGHEWRWGGAYASAFITSVIIATWCLDNSELKRWGVVSTLFLLLAGFLVMASVMKMDRAYGSNDLDRVKEVLNENNLSYGYADFWDANAITMLSNDTIRVRAIELDVFEDGQVKSRAVPYRYQTEESWYADQDGIDNYFVFLRSAGYDICPPELKEAATETIEFEGGTAYILVYDSNIFADGESIYDR